MQSRIETYAKLLRSEDLAGAYREILSFLSSLRGELAKKFPDHACQALYAGYLDMSYVACTPPSLKERNLKVAIVYLHAPMRFEIWLGAVNRGVQATCREELRTRELGSFTLSEAAAGVDSILVATLEDRPDFDRQEHLRESLVEKVSRLTGELEELVMSGDIATLQMP